MGAISVVLPTYCLKTVLCEGMCVQHLDGNVKQMGIIDTVGCRKVCTAARTGAQW